MRDALTIPEAIDLQRVMLDAGKAYGSPDLVALSIEVGTAIVAAARDDSLVVIDAATRRAVAA